MKQQQQQDQHYWHKCVVLVTQINAPGANGMGKSCIQGLLLNRPTKNYLNNEKKTTPTHLQNPKNHHHHDQHQQQQHQESSPAWNVWFGEEMLGLVDYYYYQIQVKLCCLHSLTNPDAKAVSHDIITTTSSRKDSAATKKDHHLYWTTLDQAQQLVKKSNTTDGNLTTISPKDFYTIGGYCLWSHGQLEEEIIDGGGWITVSMDEKSISKELQIMRQEIIIPSKEKK